MFSEDVKKLLCCGRAASEQKVAGQIYDQLSSSNEPVIVRARELLIATWDQHAKEQAEVNEKVLNMIKAERL